MQKLRNFEWRSSEYTKFGRKLFPYTYCNLCSITEDMWNVNYIKQLFDELYEEQAYLAWLNPMIRDETSTFVSSE